MADLATTQRYALVTGANKGIGFEICRQLAAKGTTVILASRDEQRGAEARERLVMELGSEFETYVVFHQLDVVDSVSIAAVSEFIKTEFRRLDILVNNAGIGGIYIEGDSSVFQEYVEAEFKSIEAGGGQKEAFHPKGNGRIIETFEGAKECIETNYYGTKRVTQALIPLLQLSHSPTIVNVSSSISSLLLQTNEWAKGVWAKGVFSSEDSSLDEEKVEQVLQEFLKDFKEGKLQENHWPPHFAAYKVSKTAMNVYTKIAAKAHPSFCINAMSPGYTRTDITYNSGLLSEVEAAEGPVKLALLPPGGPSGAFFTRQQVLSM